MTDHRRTRADRRPLPAPPPRGERPGPVRPGRLASAQAERRLTRAERSRRTSGRRVTTASTVVGLVAALIGLTGGTTLALFSAEAVSNLRTLRAGDLNLELGDLTWTQVTPGVTNPASGDATTAPSGFRSMPGDVFELRVPVTTLLEGDNLAADLRIDVDYTPAPGDYPVTSTYHVEDESGAWAGPVSEASGGDPEESGEPGGDPEESGEPGGDPEESGEPGDPEGGGSEAQEPVDAPVGTSVTIANLLGDDPGVSAEWTIVVRVVVGGEHRWVTPTSTPAPAAWNVGTVTASLKQVRPWEGGA